MKYDFTKMDADSFELMARSLAEGVFGIKCMQYGDGPDGQREFSFSGDVKDFSGSSFSGYTIGQVKYKALTTKKEDYNWLRDAIKSEMDRFAARSEYPDNYILMTNVVLTPKLGDGIKDKLDSFVEQYKTHIRQFLIVGYDEICALLDNNRDVAITYSSHIVSGDVLSKFLSFNNEGYLPILIRFIEKELKEDKYTRLEQAGSLTEDRISIEQICIDMDVRSAETLERFKFAEKIFEEGNCIAGYKRESLSEQEKTTGYLETKGRYVLTGGPGRGKSTLCQYIAQVYRAYFLSKCNIDNDIAKSILEELSKYYGYQVHCMRVPIKIVLRDYAAWIKNRTEEESASVLRYICSVIMKRSDADVSILMLRKILSELSWIFFFDGLDEVPETSNRKKVMEEIESFLDVDLKEAKCDCLLIGTTRTQGYSGEFDNSKFIDLGIQNLSSMDCELFIKKLFSLMEEQSERRDEAIDIMKHALNDEVIGKLMHTPLQVTIIAIIVKSGGKPPRERYTLFRQFYETMINREKQKGIIETLNDSTNWIEELHLRIAHLLQEESENETNPSAELEAIRLDEIVNDYIASVFDSYYPQRDDLSGIIQKTLTDRICFLNENRDGFYSFSIRSMQEFFAGTFLVKGRPDDKACESIQKIARSSYWRNALLFSIGYLAVEKPYLEDQIVGICDDLNGRPNLRESDHTVDNICLFGSWLAIDVLSEDIFKAKAQNKFISVAASGMKNLGSDMCTKYGDLSQVAKQKFWSYITDSKDLYDEMDKIKLLLLLQSEGFDKSNELLVRLQTLPESPRLEISIHILDMAKNFGEELISFCVKSLCNAVHNNIEIPRVHRNALMKLANSKAYQGDKIVERFLFRNALVDFQFYHWMRERDRKCLNVLDIIKQLINEPHRMHKERLEIVKGLEICLYKKIKDDKSLGEALSYIRNLDDKLLESFLLYQMDSTYEAFSDFINATRQDKSPLSKILRDRFLAGVKDKLPSVEDYQNTLAIDGEIQSAFYRGDMLRLLQYSGMAFGYSITLEPGVFRRLFDKISSLEVDTDAFSITAWRRVVFVIGTDIQAGGHGAVDDDTIDFVIEALSRCICDGRIVDGTIDVLIHLCGTEYAERLFKKICKINIEPLLLSERSDHFVVGRHFVERLSEQAVSKTIETIVNAIKMGVADDSYYHLLLYMMLCGYNVLDVLLSINAELPVSQDGGISSLITQIASFLPKDRWEEDCLDIVFKNPIDKLIIYRALFYACYYNECVDREKFWPKLYYRLIHDDTVENKETIRIGIINRIYSLY